jgi:hypothetical protein
MYFSEILDGFEGGLGYVKKPIRMSDFSRYPGPASSMRYDSELLYLLFLFEKSI